MVSSHSLRVAAARRPGSWTGKPRAKPASETWPPCRLRVGVVNAGAAAAIDARTSSRWESDMSSRRGYVMVERLGRRVDPESEWSRGWLAPYPCI
jgi:hypothetical protein